MLLNKILQLVKEGYTVEFTPSPKPENKEDIYFTLKMWKGDVGVAKNFATDYYVHDNYETTVVQILEETKADINNIFKNSEHAYGEATREGHDEDILTSYTCGKCGCHKHVATDGTALFQNASGIHQQEPACQL